MKQELSQFNKYLLKHLFFSNALSVPSLVFCTKKLFLNKETRCMACGNLDQTEDIYHFILHCPTYIKDRGNITQLQQPYNKNEAEVLGTFLLEKSHIVQKKQGLHELWKRRNLLETPRR